MPTRPRPIASERASSYSVKEAAAMKKHYLGARNGLREVGKLVRLKRNVPMLVSLLGRGFDGHTFDFYVISAAPEEVVLAALEGIVPPDRSEERRVGKECRS